MANKQRKRSILQGKNQITRQIIKSGALFLTIAQRRSIPQYQTKGVERGSAIATGQEKGHQE